MFSKSKFLFRKKNFVKVWKTSNGQVECNSSQLFLDKEFCWMVRTIPTAQKHYTPPFDRSFRKRGQRSFSVYFATRIPQASVESWRRWRKEFFSRRFTVPAQKTPRI